MATPSTVGLTNTTYTAPTGVVVVAAGASIQAAINAQPAGTAFQLSAGTYTGQTISPSSGDSFYGVSGQTILDGNGAQQAFLGQGVSNVTLSGLTITNYAPQPNGIGALGTDASAVGWTVQGCTFTGITSGVAIMLGDDMVVRDCTVNGNENAGIGAWNVTGATVENNDVYGNNLLDQSPFTATGSNAGIKIAGSTNVQILNNMIHDNQSAPGIWTDIGSSGTVISGNSITGNGGPGIIDELDYGSMIENNVISGNNDPALSGFLGGGIYIQNSKNADVTNNTLSGNVGGVYLYTSDRGSGTDGAYVVNNDSVTDNTIQISAGEDGFASGISNANVQFADNTYYISGSGEMVSVGATETAAQWQSSGQDAAATGSTFSTASAIPVPVTPPSSDTLALQISQDAWNGNAEFTVFVDGKQVGGDYSASALHASGDASTFLLTGHWGSGATDVKVSFINDAYGGSAATDRNLYVNSMAYNGVTYAGTTGTLDSNGSATMVVDDATATASGPADTLTLNLSEDAYKGDADFVLYIDGKAVTTPQVVTALHDANTTQGFSVTGNFGSGAHTVGVAFVNDAYGGSATEDRNLYINGVTLNGADVFSGVKAQDSNGVSNFVLTTAH